MKLLRFQSADEGGEAVTGVLRPDGRVVIPVGPDLAPPAPASVTLAEYGRRWRTGGGLLELGEVGELPVLPVGERLLPPVDPPSFRDFYAFEQHVATARRRRGLEMLPEWYDVPVFYFSNVASIVGHGQPVRKPPDSEELDYELELGVVIGREGGDIPVEEADDYIAGFTIINDWSARDLQRKEMKVGLGPAKGKDFATSVGPWLVTPDELEERVLPDRRRGRRYDLEMRAFVNGREYSRGNARDMHWTFAELIAHASRNTRLLPGDLIGSGTVGTGCILELHDDSHPWLQPGDVVRFEIGLLGALVNPVAAWDE
jgi:fumarylacetoacetate (FAA) hydrolase